MSYKDQIEFLIVYIREAHPEMLKPGHKTGIIDRQPENIDERVILATECVLEYKFTIPTVIDAMDGKVNKDYLAWPVRIIIVDVDGKVAFYAGKGPRDFRIPPAEKAIKKLIANGGRMPPPPVPQWSEPVNGLRCGLSIDPEEPAVGDDVSVHLKFENTTSEPINFYYQPSEVVKNIAISGTDGRTFRIEAAPPRRSRRRRANDSPVKKIAPGKVFEAEIEGKIVSDSELAAFTSGKFAAVYTAENNNKTPDQTDPAVWTGKLNSGTFMLNLTQSRQMQCADCHDKSDYHHKEITDCTTCHVGEADTDTFDVNKSTCSQCHPRKETFGRRAILGPEGEFNMAHKHISDKIESKHCLLCHDNTSHRNGTVSLVDPHSGKPWKNTRTEFCLTCHDGDPPAKVSFPDKTIGSGYDKSNFPDSPMATKMGEQGCSSCHSSHGSDQPALLKQPDLLKLRNVHSP